MGHYISSSPVFIHNRRNRSRRPALYTEALYKADGASLEDMREAVSTLEELERTARRVLGGAHPTTTGMEGALRESLAALLAREETPPPGGEA